MYFVALHLIEILLLVLLFSRQPKPNGLSYAEERLLRKIERQAHALANIVKGK